MSRHADIEDLFQGLLEADPRAAVFKTLETFNKPRWEEAIQSITNAPAPACLIISAGMKPSPLRTGLNHDQAFSATLMIVSRNLRGEKEARRGAAGEPGAYDLLDITRDILLGHEPPGQYGLITPGTEQRLASSPKTVIWVQNWSLIKYA